MHPLPRPHRSSACPADLTQKHQCPSQCQTRPKGTVVTVPICSQTRSQPVRLAVGATDRARGGWGPSVSRSRSEPCSETLRLQHCRGQGTVTQPRWQHPLPAHHPARCHRAIPTWASRPEPGLLPPRAGHRGQVAPGVQGKGGCGPRLLLRSSSSSPRALCGRPGVEVKCGGRRLARSFLLRGVGPTVPQRPEATHGCQRLGAGAASRERKQRVPTSSWQRNRCGRAVSASPLPAPGHLQGSRGHPLPLARVSPAWARRARLTATSTALS